MRKLLIVGIILATAMAGRAGAQTTTNAPLVAHEWGTFTALQDDDGTAIGAINADDEPVPDFVCRIGNVGIAPALSPLTPALLGGKGLSPCHPDVTLRLETPVIYFYPSETGRTEPVNVKVKFLGGWLTEFYPRAESAGAELSNSHLPYPPITSDAVGSLFWKDLEVGAVGDLTPTDDPVWTTPREVARAAKVKVPTSPDDGADAANRPEKFLFYRGVGHLNSPLRVVHDPSTDRLNLYPDLSALRQSAASVIHPDLRIPAAWLVEIRPEDGFCAFRPVAQTLDLLAPATQSLASVPASFSPSDFRAGRLQELREAMHAALVATGLFPDEAAAMLKTWELSYFKSPGRRLFYLTPRGWTDRVLPLSIDGATVTRAMVGRIELVTPAQRAYLARVAAGPCPDMRRFTDEYYQALSASYNSWKVHATAGVGSGWTAPSFAEMSLSVPTIYRDYLNLGRFRDALLFHEQKQRPTPALTAFIVGNDLRARESGFLTLLSSFLPGDEHAR